MKLTLTAARVNNGYTMKEAAAVIGVHWQTLSAWERDSSRLTFNEADKLSKLYHVDKDDLFLGLKTSLFVKSGKQVKSYEIITGQESQLED